MVDALTGSVGLHLLYLVLSECDCVKCLAHSVVVCSVRSEENKSNNNPARPLHGLQISKYSPCSEPIGTLLFVCGSLCCLCFPLPSLFLLIFLHFSLCPYLVDKFIILLPAQNSDHPTMPATKEGIHLELKYFQSQHTDLSHRILPIRYHHQPAPI